MSKNSQLARIRPKREPENNIRRTADPAESMGVELLQQQLGADAARRTLRRRLAELVGRGRIPNSAHDALPASSPSKPRSRRKSPA